MVTQAEMFSPEVSTTEEFIDGRLNRKRRASNTNCEGKKCFMACKENQHLCQVYACELNTIIQPKSYVEINVTLIINMSNIDIAQDVDTLEFVSHVEVQEPRHPLFKSWAESKRKPTITTFHFIQSGRQINIWIIVGSIIAGLVLITIIVIVLWKVGFFKRTKHLEVQQKKRESSGRFMKDFPQ
ncbi:hypothetical protein Btru_059586 [Bulinus truncatus]|nr:hypothetical protein Btru_059586 [Bulinus truncatus]